MIFPIVGTANTGCMDLILRNLRSLSTLALRTQTSVILTFLDIGLPEHFKFFQGLFFNEVRSVA